MYFGPLAGQKKPYKGVTKGFSKLQWSFSTILFTFFGTEKTFSKAHSVQTSRKLDWGRGALKITFQTLMFKIKLNCKLLSDGKWHQLVSLLVNFAHNVDI